MVSSPRLVDEQQGTVLQANSDTSARAFLGVSAGLQHRFGRSWILGLLGDLVYAGVDYQALGGLLELSWVTY